jgi:hypothetical protein
MQLWRTTCKSDRTGLPDHALKLVGESHDRQRLITLMNQDIEQWQGVDIAADQQEWDEDDGMRAHYPRPTEWVGDDRFEMGLEEGEDLRKFSMGCDGYFTTICYHIV